MPLASATRLPLMESTGNEGVEVLVENQSTKRTSSSAETQSSASLSGLDGAPPSGPSDGNPVQGPVFAVPTAAAENGKATFTDEATVPILDKAKDNSSSPSFIDIPTATLVTETNRNSITDTISSETWDTSSSGTNTYKVRCTNETLTADIIDVESNENSVAGSKPVHQQSAVDLIV